MLALLAAERLRIAGEAIWLRQKTLLQLLKRPALTTEE